MTQMLFTLISFLCGIIVSIFIFSFYLNNLKQQIMKLEKQVYYWSRQMPVAKKRGRPRKAKSV